MSSLDNPKHERFVQELAKGETQRQAYRNAISTQCTDESADVSACQLANDPKIKLRLEEWRQIIAKRAEITLERIAVEYAKIGFSDLRKAAKWMNGIQVLEEGDAPTLASNVLVVPSNEVDDDTAAAIAEVSQGPNGVKIKMHDKTAALNSLTKMLGGFVERHEHTGKDGKDLVPDTKPDTEEIARRVAYLLTSGKSNT